jgi:transcriptional regulator with XRE-family HTH domain
MEFGTRLKEIRTCLNISQKELSEKTRLTLRTIQRIENNEVKPAIKSEFTKMLMEKFMDTPLAWM